MIPTLGRIVHYTDLGEGDPRQHAAIITRVEWNVEEKRHDVTLHVFHRTAELRLEKVPFSTSYQPGHWSWPPKV